MLFHKKKVAAASVASPQVDHTSPAVSTRSPGINPPQSGVAGTDSTSSDNLIGLTSSPKGTPQPSPNATAGAAPQANKQTHILIVDDDEMIRIFLRDIFWIHGHADDYDVQVSGTLEEAEKFITAPEGIPDIVFLDLMVPPSIRAGVASPSHIEGTFEFIKRFKKDPKFSRMRIVVFSGHRDKDIKDKAMSFGADDYLVKGDFMPKEIISFVEQIEKNK